MASSDGSCVISSWSIQIDWISAQTGKDFSSEHPYIFSATPRRESVAGSGGGGAGKDREDMEVADSAETPKSHGGMGAAPAPGRGGVTAAGAAGAVDEPLLKETA